MKYLRFILLLFVLLCYLPSPAQEIKDVSIKEAILKSNQQQVLSQQIIYIYLALQNNLSVTKYYQHRDNAIQCFDNNIEAFKQIIPNDKVRIALQTMRDSWDSYKKIAAWSINKEGSEKLYNLAEGLLDACKKLSIAYGEYGKNNGDIYKTGEMSKIGAGLETNTLQQVLAVQQEIGTTPNIIKKKIVQLSTNHDIVLHDLAAEQVNTTSIREKVSSMQNDWGELTKKMEKDTKFMVIEDVLDLTEKIAQISSQILSMYQS